MLTRSEVQDVDRWKREMDANTAMYLGDLCFENVEEDEPRDDTSLYLKKVVDPITGEVDYIFD